MTDPQSILRELARAKVLFQQRAIAAVLGMSETARQTDITQRVNQKGPRHEKI